MAIRPVAAKAARAGPIKISCFYCGAIKNSRRLFFRPSARLPRSGEGGAIKISCFLLQSNKKQYRHRPTHLKRDQRPSFRCVFYQLFVCTAFPLPPALPVSGTVRSFFSLPAEPGGGSHSISPPPSGLFSVLSRVSFRISLRRKFCAAAK